MSAPIPDNFMYIIYVDHILHTDDKPFCFNPTCDCHDDEVLVFQVSLFVKDGLLTPEEAIDFVEGRGI